MKHLSPLKAGERGVGVVQRRFSQKQWAPVTFSYQKHTENIVMPFNLIAIRPSKGTRDLGEMSATRPGGPGG